jgi:hypothetical protein
MNLKKEINLKIIINPIGDESFAKRIGRGVFNVIVCFYCVAGMGQSGKLISVPDDFPCFLVPGYEKEMESLRKLYYQQYQITGPAIPLWDEWLPMSTLWPAIGEADKLEEMRNRWKKALSSRFFNAEGYVVTEQHDGLAHSEGWPFPLWTQGGGVGWHFRSTGIPVYDGPVVTPEGWVVTGGKAGIVNPQGWEVELTSHDAKIQSPAFSIEAAKFPWLRLNWWGTGLEGTNCYVEWTTEDQPDFSETNRAYFSLTSFDQRRVAHASWAPEPPGKLDSIVPIARTMIPVYRIPSWKGKITGFRICFGNQVPLKIVIKSFHVAFESRHNINNSNFIRGCHDYFMWTKDISFLRSQIGRIRTSMRFIQREFDTRNRKCIYTTWPGHEGRSGVRIINGKKQIIAGEGIGSNYWDILPFGGEDALATIYYYDALKDLATLEEEITKHPQWCVPTGGDAFDPSDLRKHAQEVRDYGTKRFWNEKTSRFGTVDLDGVMHDYGFTFLNNEAVYFGFATDDQARAINTWLSGKRSVIDDTSTGPDIYHWRFGPRTSTKRNLDYYCWVWSSPESLRFGDQVQDGGGVLAWSFYDLMARIKTAGADNAEPLLMNIINWYNDTQAEGGFRAYYKNDPSRGKLQGDNVAGGIGVDKEFMESILVPQVMLYGFLGFTPGLDGFSVNPDLPDDWSSLTINRIHFHKYILTIKVSKDKKIMISGTGPSDELLFVEAPDGYSVSATDGISIRVNRSRGTL